MSFQRKITAIILLLSWLMGSIGASRSEAAGISKDAALERLVKAGLQYKDGHYAEAIKLYEEIIDGGWAGGPLYYNLGNSYFKKGALGKAILNYERARRLLPRDHDLAANYRYALSLVKNPPSAVGKSIWQSGVRRFVEFYSVDEMTLLVSILGGLTGVLYLCSLYFYWPPQRRIRILVPLGILLFVYAAGFMSKLQSQRDQAVVTASTPAKFEPRAEATAYFELSEGEVVKVLKVDGVWVKIERPDEKAGWVLSADLEKI